MVKYQVWSLDVLGHVPSECCAAYGCPCILLSLENDEGEQEHDSNVCECSCSVNDRSRVGTVEVTDNGTDHDILIALSGEFLQTSALDQVEIDDSSGMGDDLYVQTLEGEPIFQLEKLESA
jgi:hypothetical protein